MAQKTDAELTTEANVIGNETTPLANTADRVRDYLVNDIDSKLNNNNGYLVLRQFTTAGGTTVYTGTTSPAITAYATGQLFQAKINATSTGSATLNLNTLGAKKVYTAPTTQAGSGDLLIDKVYLLAYDAALDAASGGFLIIGFSSGGGTPGGSTTQVQFNNAGAFGGDADFTYDTATNILTVRWGPRVQSVASSATVTPNADADDAVKITAQAAGLTLANPSGTPVSMQPMVIRIKDNGTARSITFGAQYRAVGVVLPTTTVISKTLYLGIIWNSDDTKWDVIGYSLEA